MLLVLRILESQFDNYYLRINLPTLKILDKSINFIYTLLKMEAFNLPCVSCKSQLMDEGSLLSTYLGPFVVCEVCRALYYIDVVTKTDNKPLIVIQPTKFDPGQEYDIIRHADSRVPLKEYLSKENEEKNINPHFKQDLKSVIEESVTPSDLIRKLKS